MCHSCHFRIFDSKAHCSRIEVVSRHYAVDSHFDMPEAGYVGAIPVEPGGHPLKVADKRIGRVLTSASHNWENLEGKTIRGFRFSGAMSCIGVDSYQLGTVAGVGSLQGCRIYLFTIGWNWAHDYGTSADSPEMAQYLYNYSPVHNISDNGIPYPAILVTTADHDDRVFVSALGWDRFPGCCR